ncbi:MAG: branched-chain amino acid ABC transporter permease [Thermomicrobiales bacterium]
MSDRQRELLSSISTPLILTGIVLVIWAITVFRNNAVFERVVIVMFIHLLLVVALQIFMGNSGLGNFGQYAFVLIGAYSSIWFSLSPQEKNLALPDMPEEWWLYEQHYPFLLAVLMGGLTALLVGAVIGIAFVRLRGASFTIATFAFLLVVHSVALQWKEVTRGSRTVIGIPRETDLTVAAVFAIGALLIGYAFKESTSGLKLRSSREDEDASSSIGVNVRLMRWVAWSLSVFLCGAGGALWAHFIQQFSPQSFYLKETFLIIAMLVIGGSATVSGAVVGAVSVALASEAMRQFENWWNLERQQSTSIGESLPFQLVGFTDIVIALAMILVLILRPAGIMGGKELRWPFRSRGVPPDPERAEEPPATTLNAQDAAS